MICTPLGSSVALSGHLKTFENCVLNTLQLQLRESRWKRNHESHAKSLTLIVGITNFYLLKLKEY